MYEGRFHLSMAAFALVVCGFSVYALRSGGLTLSPAQVLLRLALLAGLLLGAAIYRFRNEKKLLNLLMMCFWAVLFSNLHMVPLFLAGQRQVESSDSLLADMDAALGIEVPDILNAVSSVPILKPVLDCLYGTLVFLMALAIIVPPLSGRMDQAKEYALGCLAAALISIPTFAFFQALGPWSTYGFAPSPQQAGYTKVFFSLKSGEAFPLDLNYAAGLITFPSFHAILAVLAALALRQTRYLRWPAAALALLIVVSTVTTGWHYVVDVWAGLLVALMSFGAARAYLRLEASGWPLSQSAGKKCGSGSFPCPADVAAPAANAVHGQELPVC
jgi:hypothetical protein